MNLSSYVKCLCVVVVFMFSQTKVQAQSPYQLNAKKDLSAIVVGGLLYGGGIVLRRHDAKLTADEIEMLDINDLAPHRRWVVENDSETAGLWSDRLKNTTQFLPILFLVEKQPRNDIGKLAVMYAEATMLTRGLTSMTKFARDRTRPFVYNEAIPIEEKTTIRARQSFFSGHTSKTASMCFFSAKIFADYHPDSKWRPVVWSAAAIVPAVTGYLRVEAGQHFPTDVITGYLVGGTIGYLVPHFHHISRQKEKTSGLQIRGGINGIWAGYTF